MKTILLILAMFLGEQVVMAQDTVKVKQPVAEQPVKVKKEHKFLKDFGKTMAQAGASVAAAVVIGGTTTIVSRKQNEVLNK